MRSYTQTPVHCCRLDFLPTQLLPVPLSFLGLQFLGGREQAAHRYIKQDMATEKGQSGDEVVRLSSYLKNTRHGLSTTWYVDSECYKIKYNMVFRVAEKQFSW